MSRVPHPPRRGRRVLLDAAGGSPRALGKFFFRGPEKIVLRGVSYGPFAPATDGVPFPTPDAAARDLDGIAALGANCIRTFTPPPRWLLDLALARGVVVLAGLPWTAHVCFLEDGAIVRDARARVLAGARACADHEATFGLIIGNEIPPDVVRWHGPSPVARFLEGLCRDVKRDFPRALLSYANYPSTEYLDLEFLDFVSFNVYLHEEAAFRRYLCRLQNLAGDRPLVLSEFGMDSLRHGEEEQARFLEGQVVAAFEAGLAGAIAFSWTDEWFTGGRAVDDWAFGLVDRERRRKPAYEAVSRAFHAPTPPPVENPPLVSVVVCAYDAERTIEACLASLCQLRYPRFEVIVVDDGSTDATADIAARFGGVRLLRQPNLGLSAARNAGAAAARGDVVAYTDSDCVVDADWLSYLVLKLREGFVAVGGPNLPPAEDALVPACVAAAPGGPTHVLLGDDVAEHIPGCNMAFLRSALAGVGGFDVGFRAAGDDVDLCWRLQDGGHPIGFSAAALVWHFRRNRVRAYLEQQMGYGTAEALLYFKHPYRFNLLGQSRWFGRIYGDYTGSLLAPRSIIYHGVFGRGHFQTLYEAPPSPLAYLPFTLEWNAAGLVLLAAACVAGDHRLLAALPLLVSVAWSLASAWRARLDPAFEGPRARLLIALLVYLGPLARGAARSLGRFKGTRSVARTELESGAELRPLDWLRWQLELAFWSEEGVEKEALLHAVIEFLLPRKYLTAVGQGWSEWDLTVHRGVFGRAALQVAVEHHGGPRRLLRVRCRLRPTPLARSILVGWVAVAGVAAIAGMPAVVAAAGVLTLLTAVGIVYQNIRLGRVLRHVFGATAAALGLRPLAGSRR